MSRIGKTPVVLESGVEVELADGLIKLKGPKGELQMKLKAGLTAEVSDSRIVIKRAGDSAPERAIHGLVRKLVANMAEGVARGFVRVLEINGVGYRAEVKDNLIDFALGYSHPIIYQLPPGVTASVERQTILTLQSVDRQLLGSVAAEIRALRPPEPYKGKGIKYSTETIRRKAGKAAAGGSGA